MTTSKTWPMADLARARRCAQEEGLDALLALTLQNFRYLSGYWPANAVVRGLYLAFLPADERLPPALTISQFEEAWARRGSPFDDIRPIQMWVEIDDLEALVSGTTVARPKPAQFDRRTVLAELADMLKSRGLTSGRIGYERNAVPAGVRAELEASLPGFEFVDATKLFIDLQAIKTSAEIRALAKATELAEAGIKAIFLDSDPRGKSVSQLRLEYDIAVRRQVVADPAGFGLESLRAYISTGGSIGPNVGRNEDIVRDGDVLWIDCGVQIDGYASDIGRTFSVGEPNATVRRIADALTAGSEAGFKVIRPGTPMREVYRTMQETTRASGLPTYTRGHVGHAVGVGIGEQPPYLGPDEERPLLPGMIIAFERPYYVRGLGGFQFEEDIAITGSGADILTRLPRGLQII